MVRLRNAIGIIAMAAGVCGCAQDHQLYKATGYHHWSVFHCGECDDFPTPAYGPNYSMAPGSYSGPHPESEASSRMGTPTSSNVPAPNYEAVATPPDERLVPPTPAAPPATPENP